MSGNCATMRISMGSLGVGPGAALFSVFQCAWVSAQVARKHGA